MVMDHSSKFTAWPVCAEVTSYIKDKTKLLVMYGEATVVFDDGSAASFFAWFAARTAQLYTPCNSIDTIVSHDSYYAAPYGNQAIACGQHSVQLLFAGMAT